MLSYSLTPDAQADLLSIYHYTVNHWGKAQANRYLAELQQTIETLAQMPTLGKQQPEIDVNTHSFIHKSHVVYYKVTEDCLVVFAVLHKSMMPVAHLDKRDSN